MRPDEYLPEMPESPATSHRVSLSPYVNEPLPNWEEFLCAHDVARLTRRPRWMVLSLALLGRFPRKRRFHGRGIGWSRTDILDWLARDQRTVPCHSTPAPALRPRITRQSSLPLVCTEPYASRRNRGRRCTRPKSSRR
jgi:predicted DNA-binding transcriptional regulator AlpA